MTNFYVFLNARGNEAIRDHAIYKLKRVMDHKFYSKAIPYIFYCIQLNTFAELTELIGKVRRQHYNVDAILPGDSYGFFPEDFAIRLEHRTED